jgi:hypothetical protein
MHNVFVLYLFSLFPGHVSASTCHSEGDMWMPKHVGEKVKINMKQKHCAFVG